jgi:hypothetical protein
MKIKKDDFVLFNKDNENIVLNSVGLVKDVTSNNATVFFIGIQKELEVSIDTIDFLDLTKTGKQHKNKVCNVCHILKEDYTDFQINQTDSKGRKTTRPSCKACREKIDGIGLSSVEIKKFKTKEPKLFFVCPICKKGSIPGVTAKLVKDHDHQTGKARDWICDSCNTGLGRFRDDDELLKSAITYLNSFKSNECI